MTTATATQTKYTVVEATTSTGKPVFRVHNTRYDRVAAVTPKRDEAMRWAAFLNEEHGDVEVDSDWVPGSTNNWWARNEIVGGQ